MLGFPCLGQEVVIKVQPVVEGRSIEIGTGFGLDGDSVSISQLRFYLSEVTFLNDQDTIWTEPEIYRLLNLSDTSTLSFSAYVPHPNRFDAVRFRLGVDSISSSTGAHTGALDPANGMYWAWHTGYVNLKLEGNCNSCPGPQKTFDLHIGGFQFPFDAEREVTLYTADRYVNIYFDIGLILKAAFSTHQYQIMTPGEKAMRIADAAAKAFHLR